MKTTTTVFFASLLTLIGFSSVLFYSCNKDDDPKPFYLYVENPFPYDIRIKGHLKGCGYGGDGCLHYPGKIYEGATPGHSGNIQAFNDETGDAIDLAIYDADMEGGYVWVVGSGNHLVKVEDYDNGSGNGGGNSGGNNGGNNGGSGGCPGAQAQHYKDLMDNNSTNDCQQIWAQQAAWHAYKCNCDEGLANASDAKKMVAVLNSIRKNIQDLYKSGGNPNSTKCGATPPTVSKCNVK